MQNMEVFLNRQEHEEEEERLVSYEEMRPTKSTDINPHIFYGMKTEDNIFDESLTFSPCKDRFVNYLGYQAGYLQLSDLIDPSVLADPETNERQIRNQLISPEKSLYQFIIRLFSFHKRIYTLKASKTDSESFSVLKMSRPLQQPSVPDFLQILSFNGILDSLFGLDNVLFQNSIGYSKIV